MVRIVTNLSWVKWAGKGTSGLLGKPGAGANVEGLEESCLLPGAGLATWAVAFGVDDLLGTEIGCSGFGGPDANFWLVSLCGSVDFVVLWSFSCVSGG